MVEFLPWLLFSNIIFYALLCFLILIQALHKKKKRHEDVKTSNSTYKWKINIFLLFLIWDRSMNCKNNQVFIVGCLNFSFRILFVLFDLFLR